LFRRRNNYAAHRSVQPTEARINLKSRSRLAYFEAGFQKRPMIALVLLVIFIAMLFASRQLNRQGADSDSAEVRYSDRYQELIKLKSLNQAQQAELELEVCRYKRDSIRFLLSKPLANRDAEISSYREVCERYLPFDL